jgi:DNA gyrase/topoisomerase IV subunit B
VSKIEQKYRKLTDIEHVLLRPFMYIGSISPHKESTYLYDGETIWQEEVEYNPGFIKIFDEIISNSVDEHKRTPKLNHIKVNINIDTGEISIWDNGGIPVVEHAEHKQWIPEMIFSNLKSGSNFDDSEQRTVAGTNGVGSTLTNIFSKKFSVSTCDGKKKYHQVFSNNMHDRTDPKITNSGKGFTEISYIPDLIRFGMEGIDETTYLILFKRCLDVAACNNKLKVTFTRTEKKQEKSWDLEFKSFKDYISLYTADFYYEESKDWQIAFSKSENGFSNISFVNSVFTKDGGTHVDYITNQLIIILRELIKKKHKVEVKPNEIRNYLKVFINCTVVNSSFSSQTKEKLITEARDFNTQHEVLEKTAKEILKSEIVAQILDWIENKERAQERAELRKLNKNLDKKQSPKLIDAQKKGDREDCTLGIYEGLSALSAVRKFRDTQTIGAFPLKGKFVNVTDLKSSEIIKNKEAVELMAAIGLKLGEPPTALRYGKVLIYTDADPDGNSIAALLINFFNRFWPELFEEGRIFKVMTPLVVAKRGKQTLSFYTNTEFQEWYNKITPTAWQIEYKKGLAALEDIEYETIIKNPKVLQISNDQEYKISLEAWFGKDSQPRKERILNG